MKSQQQIRQESEKLISEYMNNFGQFQQQIASTDCLSKIPLENLEVEINNIYEEMEKVSLNLKTLQHDLDTRCSNEEERQIYLEKIDLNQNKMVLFRKSILMIEDKINMHKQIEDYKAQVEKMSNVISGLDQLIQEKVQNTREDLAI